MTRTFDEVEEVEQLNLKILRLVEKLDRRMDKLMATLQDVVDAVAQDQAAVEAAASRAGAAAVITGNADLAPASTNNWRRCITANCGAIRKYAHGNGATRQSTARRAWPPPRTSIPRTSASCMACSAHMPPRSKRCAKSPPRMGCALCCWVWKSARLQTPGRASPIKSSAAVAPALDWNHPRNMHCV